MQRIAPCDALFTALINASESRERVNNYNLSQISKRLAKAFLVLDQERCLFVCLFLRRKLNLLKMKKVFLNTDSGSILL